MEEFDDLDVVEYLRKTGLNIGVIFQPPWAYPCSVNATTKCSYPGMGIEFTDTFCHQLGIVCRYVFQNITEHQVIDTHVLLANRILVDANDPTTNLDTVLPVLTQTPELGSKLNFTMPVFYMEHGALIRTTYQEQQNEMFFVVKPFHWSVWLTLVVALLAVSLLEAFYHLVLTCKTWREDKRKTLTTYAYYAETSALMMLSVILSRGMDSKMTHLCRRILTVVWGLSCVIICNVYSAQLTSTKVALKTQPPFSNLKDLAEELTAHRYKLLIYAPDSKFMHDVETNPDGPYRYLHDAFKTNQPTYVHDVDNLTERIYDAGSTEKLALFASQFTLKALAKTNCNLTIVPLGVTDFGSFAFRPGNGYALLFTKIVLSFKERGYYMEMLERKYSFGRNCESRTESSQSTGSKDDMQKVGLKELQIIFWTLLFGCLCAGVGFAVETVYDEFQTMKSVPFGLLYRKSIFNLKNFSKG